MLKSETFSNIPLMPFTEYSFYQDSTTFTSLNTWIGTPTRRVKGEGVVFVSTYYRVNSTGVYGPSVSEIELNDVVVDYYYNRVDSSTSDYPGANTSIALKVKDGDKIECYAWAGTGLYTGTKYLYAKYLCFGCTLV